jgi:protein-L-isoaspartate O-methyltransferase
VLPVGEHDGDQELVLIERTPAGDRRQSLGGVRFVPFLPGMG